MEKAYLGLGANIGDPVQQIIDARKQLKAIAGVSSFRSSSLYLTSSVGDESQPDYINCVVESCLDKPVKDYFAEIQAIELALGRERDPHNRNAARCIDIDLLMYGDQRVSTASLELPHPRLQQRLFVLQPLFELEPNLQIADRGSVRELITRGQSDRTFAGQYVFRLGR